jgi:hypothetical protein
MSGRKGGLMKLFKSREERRLEREMEIRKGINLIRRNIRDLARNEKAYIEKARKAREIGSAEQLEFLKRTLKQTAGQRRLMERQLLNIETAAQIKNQAEAHAQFARAMDAVSRSISEMFGATDMARTQLNFEKAMARAATLEERMNLFLDLSSRSMFDSEPAGEEIVSDEEIERLIAAPPVARALAREVQEGLAELRRELGKEEEGDEPAPRQVP